jgi:hypothetical protein
MRTKKNLLIVGQTLGIAAMLLLAACGKSPEPNGFKSGTTTDELKAQSAAIALRQEAALAAETANDTRTALSRAAANVTFNMQRADVIALLGTPSAVITPSKLKVNDIARGPEIEYVLTWDNPGCSRVEVFFDAGQKVTGTDAGRICEHPMKPLATDYSCSKPSNAKYCG